MADTSAPGMILAKDDSTATTGAIAHSKTVTNVSQLISVSLEFNIAPATSENLTITLNANAGDTYDILLYDQDMSALAVTSLIWYPPEEQWLEPGDAIDVAFTNTDARTFGSQITLAERR